MTSLDFQSLLKQEKALLRQAERAKQSATSATSATSAMSTRADNAAQPEASLKIRLQNDQNADGSVSDAGVNRNGHPLSSTKGSLAENCTLEEPVNSERCPLRREPSPSFEELANRPSLDPWKVSQHEHVLKYC